MRQLFTIILAFMTTVGFAQLKPVKSGAYHWSEFSVKKSNDRESRFIMEGSSPHFEYLEIHATTQHKGAKPNPIKSNPDKEEVIIVKEGLIKISVNDQHMTMGPGGVLLLLPQSTHILENVGEGDASYYVMGYRSKKPMDLKRGLSAGGSMLFNPDSLEMKASSRGGGRAYFDRPTAMCENFEMHVTRLDQKGPSHDPHQHVDTEIILVISGQTEMTIDGKEYKAGPGDLYFMESNFMHGVRNATDEPCMYFAYKWR